MSIARGPLRWREEFLCRLGGRVDFAVDEHSAGVCAAGTRELPCHRVSLACQLRPFGVLRRILFEPEVAVIVREAAQVGVAEPVRPGLHVREDCRRSPHAFIVALQYATLRVDHG